MAVRRPKLAPLLMGALAIGLLVVLGVQQAPEVRSSLRTFGHLHWGWLAWALGAQAGSMAALAHSQRQLLQVNGTKVSARSTMAVAYASNALSVSLPLAGASVGTAFSFRQFRRRGVDTATASWALTVSGVMSSIAFALLMTVGALLTDSPTGATIGLSGAAATALPMLALLLSLRFGNIRHSLNGAARWLVGRSRRWFDRPGEDAADAFEKILNQAAALRATPRQYGIAFFMSLRNWTADCVCLGASIAATGAHVPLRGLLLAYCLAMAAGSFGITPGGVGVVELALTASLVAAHMPADQALAAVVIYRLISFWLVMVIGWILVARLSSRGRATADEAAVPLREAVGEAPASSQSSPPETSVPLG